MLSLSLYLSGLMWFKGDLFLACLATKGQRIYYQEYNLLESPSFCMKYSL